MHRIHSSWLIILFVCLVVTGCTSSNHSGNKKYSKLSLSSNDRLLSGKLFRFAILIDSSTPLANMIYVDPVQQKLARSIQMRYLQAIKTCEDSRCLVSAFLITQKEKEIVASILKHNGIVGGGSASASASSGLSAGLVKTSLVSYNKNDIDIIVQTEFTAINYIIDTYLGGKAMRYPKIDGPSFLKEDAGYLDKVKKAIGNMITSSGRSNLFYQLPMMTALKLLELNGRNEAVRYEPLTSRDNEEPYQRVKTTAWDKYEYSAILVPGLGPQLPGVALDPGGAKRCLLAAAAYRKGEAPFIIVSGGHVHPDKTQYSEAIEMKKYLVGQLNIPGSAVITEPYARHTTTNIRNAARLIFSFGIPSGKPVMIVTDVLQSTYILMMKGRFIDELGYLPYKEIKKSRSGAIYFLPDSSALKINPLDPLDP